MGEGRRDEGPSCAYCAESNFETLLRCDTCDKWFCNGARAKGRAHILYHAAINRSHPFSTHPSCPITGMRLECAACESTNVFALRFFPGTSGARNLLICRYCFDAGSLGDVPARRSADWLPLVRGNRVIESVCRFPSEPCSDITENDINRLEAKWRGRPEETVQGALQSIPVTFHNCKQYSNVFREMVLHDRRCAAAGRRSEEIRHVSCHMVGEKGSAFFYALRPFPWKDIGLSTGDVVSVLRNDKPMTFQGTIAKTEKLGQEQWCIIIVTPPARDASKHENTASFIATAVPSENEHPVTKKLEALMRFSFASSRCEIARAVLGHPSGRRLSPSLQFDEDDEGFKGLNESQQAAVKAALSNAFTLIQGPPGTGKTSTSVQIIRQLLLRKKTRVLVCAPSNAAVDHLSESMYKNKIDFIRVQPRYREENDSGRPYTLGSRVREIMEAMPLNRKKRDIVKRALESGRLSEEEKQLCQKLEDRAVKKILAETRVVACTCIGAGSRWLRGFKADFVLIDEASQATEPETLVPLFRGEKQVALVGDHRQLGPVVLSNVAGKKGFARSLFERLAGAGSEITQLNLQYRTHPFIYRFSSMAFYGGTVLDGVPAEKRDASGIFPWPNPEKPMLFYDCSGVEEVGDSGASFLNEAEARATISVVDAVLESGAVRPDEVGIISPYRAQCEYMRERLLQWGTAGKDIYEKVEISTVDAYQGREKEIIILSCVRNNEERTVGFIGDERRLNVSLTRARRGLIAIGKAEALRGDKCWSKLLLYMGEHSLAVTGPIRSLAPLEGWPNKG
ncbi:RNA helicase (UPF2 interacting domain) Type III restriction enzyme res subunit AAA domain [Trypanosoma vivax]|uniref:Upf1 domain-containing protein n=1 Tax=Trypanosoma vivax (strain Y486) TaxID=1055687 RepID=F9WSH3_TRYVY